MQSWDLDISGRVPRLRERKNGEGEFVRREAQAKRIDELCQLISGNPRRLDLLAKKHSQDGELNGAEEAELAALQESVSQVFPACSGMDLVASSARIAELEAKLQVTEQERIEACAKAERRTHRLLGQAETLKLARATVAELVGLMRGAEWEYCPAAIGEYDSNYCHECGNNSHEGHTPSCEFGAAIAKHGGKGGGGDEC